MEIQSTKNYAQFKLIRENRVIRDKQVKNLMFSLEKQNLMEFLPVLVNEDGEVIDGQHRIEAAKRLNLPVYYTVAKGTNIGAVRILNEHNKNWILRDYVDSYAKSGKEPYKILRNFIDKYSVAVSPAVIMFATETTKGNALRRSLRAGEFKADGLKAALRIVNVAQLIQKNGEPSMWTNKSFMHAVITMVRSPKFDEKVLNNKIAQTLDSGGRKPYLFHNQVDVKNFLREFEEIYNFNMKLNLVRFF